MGYAEILVGILGLTLALFLILSIALVVYLIKIAQQIKRVTSTVERVAGKFEDMASVVQKAAGPAIVTKLVGDLVQRFADRNTRKSRKGDDDEES